MTSWLPELVRRRPARDLAWRYRPVSAVIPESASRSLRLALRAAGVSARPDGGSPTHEAGQLPWMTLVFGVIPRTVHEEVRIAFGRDGGGPLLEVRCSPIATHEAHATGLALILAVASAVWLVGGPVRGLLPAATTVVGGSLWTDVTRRTALLLLDRRLARLTDDLGRAVWTGGVGRIERTEA